MEISLLLKPQVQSNHIGEADKIAKSIHELREEEKILARPNFISILKTKNGDTPLLLSKKMALNKNQLEILLIMNGLTIQSDEQISEGTLIKMIVN